MNNEKRNNNNNKTPKTKQPKKQNPNPNKKTKPQIKTYNPQTTRLIWEKSYWGAEGQLDKFGPVISGTSVQVKLPMDQSGLFSSYFFKEMNYTLHPWKQDTIPYECRVNPMGLQKLKLET